MSKESSKSSINWGGVTNTLLATGAIVGGLILVAPTTMGNLGESISNLFSGTSKVDKDALEIAQKVMKDPNITDKVGETSRQLAEKIDAAKPGIVENTMGAITGGITKGIGAVIAKVVGGVIAVMGINHLINGKSSTNNSQEHAERFAEQKESFAIREDIRKMQAVMMARMQAAGHEQGPQRA
ncbi:MAG: hypothetical protein EBV03_01635 [Proteobacteria bacterium]|nr:hypothetical protein [Pseudomonadota bacterium]